MYTPRITWTNTVIHKNPRIQNIHKHRANCFTSNRLQYSKNKTKKSIGNMHHMFWAQIWYGVERLVDIYVITFSVYAFMVEIWIMHWLLTGSYILLGEVCLNIHNSKQYNHLHASMNLYPGSQNDMFSNI